MKRRNRFSFQDSPTSSKAICQSCYENNITSFTVPYIMDNGRPDKGFRQCPECNDIIPVKLTRMESLTQPLGSGSIGEPIFEVANPSKSRSRKYRELEENQVFKVEDYPLAGKEDKDLRYFANQGIILSVNDENVDTTEGA